LPFLCGALGSISLHRRYVADRDGAYDLLQESFVSA
jgi:hypothetical protein